MRPFDATEYGYTATALSIGPVGGETLVVDFEKWGNPEREKANYGVTAANIFYNRRRLGAR